MTEPSTTQGKDTPAPTSEGTPAEQQLRALEAQAVRLGFSSLPLKDGRTLKVATRRLRITHTFRGGNYEPVPERPQYAYKATHVDQVEYLTREQALRLLEEEA